MQIDLFQSIISSNKKLSLQSLKLKLSYDLKLIFQYIYIFKIKLKKNTHIEKYFQK